ncbi:amidase, partial [Variovorax sp. CT11-76]
MTRSSSAPLRRPARLAACALAVLAMGAQAQQPAAPDIATLTASEAVRELCAGRLTSEQLVTAYVAQARAKANLNAFITLDEQGALAAARAAD